MKKKIQKPFNVGAAKEGAKVETKEGRSVRIICYNRAGTDYPIVALVSYEGSENCETYTIKGELVQEEISEEDLVIIEEAEVSKFNVGDWLLARNGGGQPWLITKVTPNWYGMQDIEGHKDNVSRTTVDNYFRLWTIKDAKPGNILIDELDHPFIFKELVNGAPSAYCGIDSTHSIFIGTGNPWTKDPAGPATYEKRKQLFNQLKEGGYMWDDREFTLWKKCN